MKKYPYNTNYHIAIKWLRPSLILCNDIPQVDSSVYDNMRFSWEDDIEIYQWYLTSLTEDEVEWLENNFEGLLFTYSEMLDIYILCVDHFGTAWNYVPCKCAFKNAEAKEGDRLGL